MGTSKERPCELCGSLDGVSEGNAALHLVSRSSGRVSHSFGKKRDLCQACCQRLLGLMEVGLTPKPLPNAMTNALTTLQTHLPVELIS